MAEIYDDPAAPEEYGEPPRRQHPVTGPGSGLDALGPVGPQGPVGPTGQSTDPTVRPAWQDDDALADSIAVSAVQTREYFAQMNESTVAAIPDTTTWAVLAKNDPAVAYVAQDVTEFFATAYGSENLAAAFGTQVFNDPLVRERALSLLSRVRDMPTGSVAITEAGLIGQVNSGELLQRVLENPTSFAAFSAPEKIAVAKLAEELLGQLEGLPNEGMVQDINTAMAVGVSGDLSLALSAEQIELLRRQLPAEFAEVTGARLTGETLPLAPLGIEQVRNIGEGVVVLNSDWAKADPAGAYAIKTYLEAEMPGVEIQWDRDGLIASFFDKWGTGVDYVSAPVAALALQIDEGIENLTTSPEDRAKMAAHANALEASLKSGEIADDDVQQTLNTINQLRDESTIELGWDQFKDDMFANTHPRRAGAGFADSMMRALSIDPGEPWYTTTYSGLLIASNIAFDPLTYILPFYGGVRAAGVIPKYRVTEEALAAMGTAEDIAKTTMAFDDSISYSRALAGAERLLVEARTGELVPRVGRSWVMQTGYRMFARFPEEMSVVRPMSRAKSRLWRTREAIGPERLTVGLVQGWGISPDAARLIADSNSLADMEFSLTRAQTGMHYTPPNIAELQTRLGATTGELAQEGLAVERRAELLVQEAWLDSVIRGEDWVRPLRQLPSARDLRKLERLVEAPFGPHGKAVMAMTDFVEKFPANLLRNRAARLAASGDRSLVASAKEAFVRLEHMYTDPGTGGLLVLPHTTAGSRVMRRVGAQGEILLDAGEEGLSNLMSLGRTLGLPRKRIQELFAPWARGELTNSSRSYYWWNQTWESMIDESPVLGSLGKSSLRQWSDSYIMERTPGFVSYVDEAGITRPQATLYTEVTNPVTGATIEQGAPAFSADMLQGVRIPTQGDMRTLMTSTGRTMDAWEKLGGAGKKFMSRAHLDLVEAHTAANSVWRASVLMAKMPSALPARIFGEQMARIWGFDYASLVSHPAEWFMSTKVGERMADLAGSDVVLFPRSPIESLGAMTDNLDSHVTGALLHLGRRELVLEDGLSYFRSYSARLKAYYTSPEVHQWHMPFLGDSERTLDAMQSGRYADDGAEFLAYYADRGWDPVWAVERSQQELTQMIGTGPGAEKVRVALQRGEVESNGRLFSVGDAEFGEELQRMYNAGEWVPDATYLARSAADYLPASKRSAGLIRFRDFMFRNFYTRPDLAMSRSPLFRQMAAREYRNLVRRGYSPVNAMAGARAYAARGTADFLFTLGAKTSGEYFLRNISPFFPAWRELATTWLKRVPLARGQGVWAFGAASLARKGDVWMDFFKSVGIIREDEHGRPYVPIPGLENITKLMTGADTGFVSEAPMESFLGLFPFPMSYFEEDEEGNPLPLEQRLQGLLPSLGAVDGLILHGLNELSGGKLGAAEDWLTMFGADQSLGPAAVDRFLEAFGIMPPWMTNTTRDFHENLRTWAVIDGIRIAMQDREQPDPRNFDADQDGVLSAAEEQALETANRTYAEAVMGEGERYATGMYVLRGIMSMVLPFSVKIQDDAKSQMETMWALINSLPNQNGRFGSALISSMLVQYPYLEPYMTGKTQDLRLVDDPKESLDEWMEAVRDPEQIMVRSEQEWTIFAMGMNSYAQFQSRLAAVYEEAGGTPAEWLVNFDAKDALEEERIAWNDFLDATTNGENFLPGQSQSFMDMLNTYEEYKELRDGDEPRLSRQQEKLLDFSLQMKEYAKYFSVNPESADKYFKMREAAFDALFGAGTSDISRGTEWWFSEIADPYYNQRNELYDELDRTDDRWKFQGYEQLRQLADEYNVPHINAEHPEWGDFPSPEEYVFLKLNHKDQQAEIANWADLPATFLTEFQREQVGYSIPDGKQDAAGELASFIAGGETRFKQYVESNGLSYQSTAIKEWRLQFDQAYADKAKELGLSKYWKEANAPAYERVGNALDLGSRTAAWAWAVDRANSARDRVEDAEYGTKLDTDHMLRRALVNDMRTVRRDDAEFDAILNELAVSLGEPGKPLTHDDLILTLFFEDPFGTGRAYYLD